MEAHLISSLSSLSSRALNVGAALKINNGLQRKNPVKDFTFNFF